MPRRKQTETTPSASTTAVLTNAPLRKRGRPPKIAQTAQPTPVPSNEFQPAPKKRGRPPKTVQPVPAPQIGAAQPTPQPEPIVTEQPAKRRGRPPKSVQAQQQASAAPQPEIAPEPAPARKRGRPRKTVQATPAVEEAAINPDVRVVELASEPSGTEPAPEPIVAEDRAEEAPARRRRRPRLDQPRADKPRTPYKNISRVDHAPKRTYGWSVRVRYGGRTIQKFFSDKQYGNREEALREAVAFRNQAEQELGRPRTDRQVVGLSSRSSTGVIGVLRMNKLSVSRKGTVNRIPVYEVTWSPAPNEIARTSVAITKWGEEEAFRRAVAIRRQKEQEVYLADQRRRGRTKQSNDSNT